MFHVLAVFFASLGVCRSTPSSGNPTREELPKTAPFVEGLADQSGHMYRTLSSGADRAKQARRKEHAGLPEPGEETEADSTAVRRVAGEVGKQEALFVQEASSKERHERRDQEQCAVRAKRERNRDEEKSRAEVHGMTDHAVRAAGNDLLVFLDLDGGGSVGVGAKNQKENPVAEEHACVAEKDDGKRNGGPAEAMIESGQDHKCKGENHRAGQNKFLRGTRFGARAGFETVFDKMRVREQEVESNGELEGREDAPEEPGLPKVKSPRRQKEKQSRDNLEDGESGQRVERESVHGTCFA